MGKLDFSYVPPEMPHRESQYKRLFTLMRPVAEANATQNVLLKGAVGTGKTHLSKRFCDAFPDYARERGTAVETAYVNCRAQATEFQTLLAIMKQFQTRYPERGIQFSEMLRDLARQLDSLKAHLVLVLDEVDFILARGDKGLVYSLTRIREGFPGLAAKVSILMVSTKDVTALMDPASLSTFKAGNVVDFTRYTEEELVDIVRQRVEMAFHPGTVMDDAVGLIAKIAAERGDARRAIEVLSKAGLLADEGGAEAVQAEHVRRAKSEVEKTIDEEALAGLKRQHLLTLLAIARRLKRAAETRTGEVEEAYALVCEEFGEEARGHTQLWKYIQTLADYGFIEASVSKEGTVGRTTLIALADVPAANLEEVLTRILGEGK
jgi:cell division control protein 6